jgi:uncharacterized delta-60 repeat protein
VIAQASGKIVVGGNLGTRNNPFFVARFNTDGSLDRTFGTGGETVTPFSGNDTASSIGLDPAGRIVLAGYGGDATTGTLIDVARYTANGRLDSHFGNEGKLITSFAPQPNNPNLSGVELLLEPQGTLVVAGTNDSSPAPYGIALAEFLTAP